MSTGPSWEATHAKSVAPDAGLVTSHTRAHRSAGLDLRHGLLARSHDDHLCPAAGERSRDRATDPVRAARHEGDLSVETHGSVSRRKTRPRGATIRRCPAISRSRSAAAPSVARPTRRSGIRRSAKRLRLLPQRLPTSIFRRPAMPGQKRSSPLWYGPSRSDCFRSGGPPKVALATFERRSSRRSRATPMRCSRWGSGSPPQVRT